MATEEPHHHADPELPPPPAEPMDMEEYLHALVSYNDRLAASAQGPNVAPPTEPTNLVVLVTGDRVAAWVQGPNVATEPSNLAVLVTTFRRLAVNRVYVSRAGEERDGAVVVVVGADDAYGHGAFGAVPASGDAMAALPEATEEECAVCLERYEAGDTLRTMPCSHAFHGGCILGWLAVSRLCPLCRFALPAEEESEAEDEGSDDDGEDVAC